MNRIRDVDPANFSMAVEAGCILENAQNAARAVDRYLPLSLGAEGSCQVGGNIATNAGGINVLKYGTTRSLVMGLEVVLADGRVLDTMRSLRKDNTGYDLKQLFIGSEGTLGIITAATLRRDRVSLLNVWYTWCVPCRQEHPVLVGIEQRLELVEDPALPGARREKHRAFRHFDRGCRCGRAGEPQTKARRSH